ncbi:MAG: hypothetical protein R3A52_03180 [Polyangiales bacterium]
MIALTLLAAALHLAVWRAPEPDGRRLRAFAPRPSSRLPSRASSRMDVSS